MKRILIIFSIICLFYSCNSNKAIIKVISQNEETELIVSKDIKEIELFFLHEKVFKISGLTQLKKLQKLYFLGIDGIDDYSFIKEFKELEILMFVSCQLKNFSFLKELKNLKVFYIEGIEIEENIIDFKNNQSIEFITLKRLSSYSTDKKIEIILKNVPNNIKYVDLSANKNLILNDNLLTVLSPAEFIFLNKSDIKDINKNYYSNISLEFPDKILPIEYRTDELFKKIEFILQGTN